MGTIISWTNETWNPTTGCTKVSKGCDFCYAEQLSLRFGWSRKPWTKSNETENLVLHPERLDKPRKFKPGTRCFVNSMSDLFHPLVPDDFLASVFRVMAECPHVTFQVLTKRPARAAKWAGPWAPNIWMGTSVEDAAALFRVDYLRRCQARTRFLSCEPLLGPLTGIDLAGIDWVIAGGESGRHIPQHPERFMRHEWARELRDACVASGVAFFFKQRSAVRTEMGNELIEADGSTSIWEQYPDRAPTVAGPLRLLA